MKELVKASDEYTKCDARTNKHENRSPITRDISRLIASNFDDNQGPMHLIETFQKPTSSAKCLVHFINQFLN